MEIGGAGTFEISTGNVAVALVKKRCHADNGTSHECAEAKNKSALASVMRPLTGR